MPLQLEEREFLAELGSVSSALIVPCNLCPAVTVAVKQRRPFIRITSNPLKSAPFEEYVRELESRLKAEGITTTVFANRLWHQWFVCMWSSGRRRKLAKHAKNHDAVIVLGCESATTTVRDAVEPTGCRVIQGMEVIGFMNARPKLHWPGDISFEGCQRVPIGQQTSAVG